MKRFLTLFTVIGALLTFAPVAVAKTDAETVQERYGVYFYGIELPREGANVLMIIDVSKSMSRKDAARSTPGRRWDTLLDEVQSMREEMVLAAEKRGVPFHVSVIFEGGNEPHTGEGPFNMADKAASEKLQKLLTEQTFKSGGSFETTFTETLWEVVTRHAITYVIYLGDDDIGTYATPIREAVTSWYTASTATKPTAQQRKHRHQQKVWRKAWANWRPMKRGTVVLSKTKRLPPPPKQLTFSCVAIGQASPLQEELAKLGNGQYVERKGKAAKKSRKKAETK